MDGKEHDLQLGSTFGKNPSVSYHSIRYDFQPASVDSRQLSTVEIDKKKSVTVTVPHIEGSSKKETVYKGVKRPLQKECVLIVNNKTGEVTLEKLASNMQVKKTRQEGSTKSANTSRPVTPVESAKTKETAVKTSNSNEPKNKIKDRSEKEATGSAESLSKLSTDVRPASQESLGLTLSESDSDSSDSSSDEEKQIRESRMDEALEYIGKDQLIEEDLNLSDSDSD